MYHHTNIKTRQHNTFREELKVNLISHFVLRQHVPSSNTKHLKKHERHLRLQVFSPSDDWNRGVCTYANNSDVSLSLWDAVASFCDKTSSLWIRLKLESVAGTEVRWKLRRRDKCIYSGSVREGLQGKHLCHCWRKASQSLRHITTASMFLRAVALWGSHRGP